MGLSIRELEEKVIFKVKRMKSLVWDKMEKSEEEL
jgi:hypothetical protein